MIHERWRLTPAPPLILRARLLRGLGKVAFACARLEEPAPAKAGERGGQIWAALCFETQRSA
jgi:hypothetical protein